MLREVLFPIGAIVELLTSSPLTGVGFLGLRSAFALGGGLPRGHGCTALVAKQVLGGGQLLQARHGCPLAQRLKRGFMQSMVDKLRGSAPTERMLDSVAQPDGCPAVTF